MNRRVVAGVLAGVLGALLAGCAGGPSGSDRLPRADDPVAWAGRVCAALQPLASLKGQPPDFDPNNPAASRDSLSEYFAATADKAGQSLTGLDQAGPSPIQGGDDAAAKLRGALQRMQAAYADARAKVDRVDPSDPVGLGSQLPTILSTLASASADPGLKSLGDNPALNDAVKQASSCSLVALPGGGQ